MTSNKNVLYVDDEETNLFLFETLFKDSFNITCVDSGEKGLEILNSKKDIDVVISDLNMPIMDGIQFISNAHNEFSSIPYYLLSGYAMNNDIQDLISKGLIKGYWMKPMNFTEIINAVQES